MEKFQNIRCEHSPKSANRYADALATLAYKIHILEENRKITVSVVKRTLPCSISELLQPPGCEDDDDWRAPIVNKFVWPTSASILDLKHFALIHGVLYHRSTSGVLARCVSNSETKERLKAIHE